MKSSRVPEINLSPFTRLDLVLYNGQGFMNDKSSILPLSSIKRLTLCNMIIEEEDEHGGVLDLQDVFGNSFCAFSEAANAFNQ